MLGAARRFGARVLPWLLVAACASLATEYKPLVSDEAIRAQGARLGAPLWRLPLGSALVEDMRLIAPERLLVGLRLDDEYLPNRDVLLLDAASGKVLWRYDRQQRPGTFTLVLADAGCICFRVDAEGGTSLLGLDAASGAERWNVELRAGTARVEPLLGQGALLAAGVAKGEATLAAYDTDSGARRWERHAAAPGAEARHPPLVTTQAIWHFYEGVTRLAPERGETLWSRGDVHLGPLSPPPVLAGAALLVIDGRNRLLRLDAERGTTLGETALDAALRYTNIYPYGERIYLRAERPAAPGAAPGGGAYTLQALDARSGRVLWSYRDSEPSISNLIEHGGRVYVATQSRLLALGLDSGARFFSRTLTNSGRTYPVHLRRFGETIVFIGELLIVGVDARSGALTYTQGMNPLAPETSLTSLDAAIRAGEGIVVKQDVTGDVLDLLAIYSSEARDFQNLSNSYHQMQAGDYVGAATSLPTRRQSGGSTIDLNSLGSRLSNLQYGLDLSAAVSQTAGKLFLMVEEKKRRIELARQKFFRRAILSAYAQTEWRDYVFRPQNDFDSNMAGISLVHLPDGKRDDVFMSPNYLTFGLWNLVDFEHKVVYHHGIGLRPEQYRFGPPTLQRGGLIRVYENFLIARPLHLSP
jgi:outer membrane protein assembly factor BamB